MIHIYELELILSQIKYLTFIYIKNLFLRSLLKGSKMKATKLYIHIHYNFMSIVVNKPTVKVIHILDAH